VISGTVQMVGFRAFAERQAGLLGITGHVRNTEAGDVEVEAEGDERAVEKFIALLRRGPAAARVTRVNLAELAPMNADTGFEVRC